MNPARLRALHDVPTLHSVPNERIVFDGRLLHLELDDHKERRIRVSFKTLQAFRVTTMDCYGGDGAPREMAEVQESPWVKELASVLKRVDRSATFMEHARHFVIPTYDQVIEVVAWGYKVDVEKPDAPWDE